VEFWSHGVLGKAKRSRGIQSNTPPLQHPEKMPSFFLKMCGKEKERR
jgi:hypothetical protein